MTTPAEIAEQHAAQLPDEQRRTFEAFKRLGMSAPAALEATRGRDEPLLPSIAGEIGSRPVARHDLAREAIAGDLTGRSQAIAARAAAREVAERAGHRAVSDAWQHDRAERAAWHVGEVVEAQQAQEARLGLRPAAAGSTTGQLREAAADKREQVVAVSEQRYLREGCTPEQARSKAERLWPDTTVLLEEAQARLSEAATRRLRELLADGRRIRDAIDQLEQEGLA